MTDEELRRAYRRMEDPLSTPARVVFLVLAMGGTMVYGALRLHGGPRTLIPAFALTVGAIYIGLSLRVRHIATRGSAAEVRDRFRAVAKRVLKGVPLLVLRGFGWSILGAFGCLALLQGAEFPLSGDRNMMSLLWGAGLLFGLHYLLEWRLEIPRVRRALHSLEVGAEAPAPPSTPAPPGST